ncbi:MAG TPA: response regulator [Opitutaceae bacterium]|nr:response regulator [Opitutaceae bacterium]
MTPTILCVDDDTGITHMLEDCLGALGFRVRTAATVLSALKVVRTTKVDLIILDVFLPDVDGYGFLELLKQESHNRGVPVIVSSGYASEEARSLAIQHGAAAYLQKPFQLQQLFSLLRWMLAPPETEPESLGLALAAS